MRLDGKLALKDSPRLLRQLADRLERDLEAIAKGVPIFGDYVMTEGDDTRLEWRITEGERDALRSTKSST